MSQRRPLDPNVLAQFTGSEVFYAHALVRDIIYSEGARYVAETARAYWLLDEIALAQRFESGFKAEPFQVWDLTVADPGSASLACGDGNGRVVYVKRIEWTDFPAPVLRLYFCNGCIHLPIEY
jgi:hypothetical protein